MITREMFNGLDRDEIQNMMGADLSEFQATIATVETDEELKKLEEELMEVMKANDAVIAQTSYELPADCTSYNQNFTRRTIADIIADFITSVEYEYQYIPGLLGLVKVWKDKNLANIPYGAYDSTLRVLNQQKYRGYNNWINICAVNEFLSSCHAEYVRDTAYLIYLADRHNIIMDQQKALHPEEQLPVEQTTM